MAPLPRPSSARPHTHPLPPVMVRRTAIAGGCVLALSLAGVTPAAAAEGDAFDVTLLATTDVHSHVTNTDYFRQAPYAADQGTGLARVKTIVDSVRAREGAESVVYVDNGDAIQGSALGTFFSTVEPVTETGIEHPMATAYNLLGLDSQTLGNHEFNYGLDNLATYDAELDAPLLGANVTDVATGLPAFDPYTIIEREIDGRTVRIGVLGLVVPGVSVWDRAHVEGKLEFGDLVTAAQKYVPELRPQVDVLVVSAHSGQGIVPSAEYDPAALEHDVANNIAELVPGIDVIVAGHSHEDAPETWYTNPEGEQVLITQPRNWARSVSEVTIPLVEQADGSLDVQWTEGTEYVTRHSSSVVVDDPAMLEAMQPYEDATVEYVATPVANSVERMETATSRYEDTPIIDFINHVQQETVQKAMVGTEYADLPVVSQASPFSRTAVFPQGEVTIADVAGLYVYDNTLGASLLTGAQLKEYLEYSAMYYDVVPAGEEFDPEQHTNSQTPYYTRESGAPDYALDQLAGVNYTIDVSLPKGERIVDLTWPDGTPVADDDQLVLAVNNYRQNGGSGYPAIADAPVVYNELQEVRQLLIDWATERGAIDPADFYDPNWKIITSATPTDPGTDPEDPEVPVDARTIFFENGFTGATSAQAPVHDVATMFVGDADGDGEAELVAHEGTTFSYAGGADNTQAVTATFGRARDVPLFGDWDGDGTSTPGVRRGNTVFLTNEFAGSDAEISYTFGRAGDDVVTGDFNGDGSDEPAVRRGNVWYFANGHTGVAAGSVPFGRADDQAFVGDWDGDGADTPGVRRGNRVLLSNTLTGTSADVEFTFGRARDVPLVGPWGPVADGIAVIR